jgi:acyl-CoA dehydrogenase
MSQATAEASFHMSIDYHKKIRDLCHASEQMPIDTAGLVEMATDIEIGRTFIDCLTYDHVMGRDILKRVSMAKWWISDMANRVVSRCMQLYGDSGYLEDFGIARYFRDVRAHPIYAGTNEIMKRIISRILDL